MFFFFFWISILWHTCHDPIWLLGIGKRIGTPLRVDISIATTARGWYAQLCVEIDLSKPFIFDMGPIKHPVSTSFQLLFSKKDGDSIKLDLLHFVSKAFNEMVFYQKRLRTHLL